ncbi:MAG: Qat anti-phage system associated protein QatB [Ginsengibacter sp.]
MGTSNSFGGQGNNTPLVPSWLGGDGNDGDSVGNDSEGAQSGTEEQGDNSAKNDTSQGQINTNSSGRFTGARTSFTNFINSDGRDRRALGRSVSSYISKASGGSRTAAKRIGASKRVATGIVDFINTVRSQGVVVALNSHNLGNLVGRPIDEVFAGLLNDICPDGGNIDEGLARNAFVETIAQLVTEGMESIDNLTVEQFQHVIEIFVTNAIEGRLYNDIGTKIIFESANVQTGEFIQAQVHDFIQGSVSDAIARHASEFENLSGLDTNILVDHIYADAYEILESLSENEANHD